jgi:hypothetical protein
MRKGFVSEARVHPKANASCLLSSCLTLTVHHEGENQGLRLNLTAFSSGDEEAAAEISGNLDGG